MGLAWRRFGARFFPYALHIPTLIILSAVLLYPWVWSLYLSFTDWNPSFSPTPIWVGLDNYRWILSDRLFHLALRNSMVLTVVSLLFETVLGLAVAIALQNVTRGVGLLRTIVLLPYVISSVVVGLIWRTLLHDQNGVVNWLLLEIGLGRIGWLGDPHWSLITVILVETWKYVPWVALILFAGLQGISGEYYEAARVDGATRWQTLVGITLPLLRPVLLVVLLFRAMFALRTFDTVYVLFGGGGPANAASVLGTYLYDTFKVSWEIGLGAAISFILLATTALVSALFSFLMRER
jgi:ABC-type sugar transport system permease subunit